MKHSLQMFSNIHRMGEVKMGRQKLLVLKLKKQRDLLSALISRVENAEALSSVSPAYDRTTQQIEQNLEHLRRFLVTIK